MIKKLRAHLSILFLLALILSACGGVTPVGTSAPETFAPEAAQTSAPEIKSYEHYGMTFNLNAPFPETPAEMKIYLPQDEVRATVDSVKALAKQFEMNGTIYETAGEFFETTDYLVVDGTRQLSVRSDRYFTYYPNSVTQAAYLPVSDNPNAEALIGDFMKKYGFDFEYTIEHKQFGAYYVLPFTPDGFVSQHNPFDINGLVFNFDDTGIESVSASLIKYNEVATAKIISAEEALLRFMDVNTIYGSTMGAAFIPSANALVKKMWLRTPVLDETITYYGVLTVIGKAITDGAPLISLDGYVVTGNLKDIPEDTQYVYVEAIGIFREVDGAKIFELDSWKIFEGNMFQHGAIQREGDLVVINTIADQKLILPDFPADITLPAEDMTVEGVEQDGVLNWKRLGNYAFDSGGGGGGGGGGYYKVNITGTPVPFVIPTPEPLPTPSPLVASFPKSVEPLRGVVSVSIFKFADGSERASYGIYIQDKEYQDEYLAYAVLEGDSLEGLNKYNNHPLDIWGTIRMDEKTQQLIIDVDRYENPYPDVQFQLIYGTQKAATVNDESVILFTSVDNVTYVQRTFTGDPFTLEGNKGGLIGTEPVIIEGYIIPGESVGEYPVVRFYNTFPAIDSITGKPAEYTITANEIYISEMDKDYPLSAAIEKIDLVYYTPNRRYYTTDPSSEPPYAQPMWRFYGHYDNGDEFEILVQALTNEYLFPEIEFW